MPHIWDLFAGYTKAYGRYDLSKQRTNDRGKVEGKALTIKEPVTQALWEAHLAGHGPGLGIIPLRTDNTVIWACIDIDIYNLDLAALEAKIHKLQMPLVMARTKSGGAHCFLFLEEPTPAKDVRNTMESWAAALGHGDCEIFPKQTSRYDEDHDLGNWLNMPYYYAEKTLRYGIQGGQRLSLDEFVEYSWNKRIDLEAISIPSLEGSMNGHGSNNFTEGPPCLQHLEQMGGFPEHRNDGMYNVAVYLRKRFPDDWQDKIQEYNVRMCTPPLTLSELNTIVKSVGSKAYGYRCKHQPIAAHCHRRSCLGRTYGVGETGEGGTQPEIGSITKYVGDPVLWFLEISNTRIMLTTEELLNQSLFKKKVVDSNINRVPAALPPARWGKFIDEKLRSCEIMEVPTDASPTGQFQMLVEQFATGQAQATSKEELVHRHSPFKTGDGEVWFRSRGLLEYLALHSFKYRSEHHVWQMLRDMKGESRLVKIKGKNYNIWVIPEPERGAEDAPLPEFGTKEF